MIKWILKGQWQKSQEAIKFPKRIPVQLTLLKKKIKSLEDQVTDMKMSRNQLKLCQSRR